MKRRLIHNRRKARDISRARMQKHRTRFCKARLRGKEGI